MKFNILTLFPEYFESPLKVSLIGKAIDSGLVEVDSVNIRDFTDIEDKHSNVDDSPYGGGVGMVLKAAPVVRAIESVAGDDASRGESRLKTKVVLLTPQGKPFNQKMAKEFADLDRLVLVCGRYEGFDERIREFVDMEVSLGDFVLTGGEAAALSIVDAVARLKEGVLGKSESLRGESFAGGGSEDDDAGLEGLLEYPQYTRPEDFRGLKVPEVLTSGNHKDIEKWRRIESLKRTFLRRPDLIEKAEANLSDEDKKILKEIKK